MASEINKQKTPDQLDHEAIDTLARHFVRGDMSVDTETLQETVADMATEWQMDPRALRGFVDKEGELVMIAKNQEGDVRMAFDSQVVDVTIPPELQEQPMHFGDGRNEIVIYDTTGVEHDMLPPGIDPLIEKFGERLSYMGPDDPVLNGKYFELDDVSRRVRSWQDRRRAYREREAEFAERLVGKRRHLFMTATKLATLQEQAYQNAYRMAGEEFDRNLLPDDQSGENLAES